MKSTPASYVMVASLCMYAFVFYMMRNGGFLPKNGHVFWLLIMLNATWNLGTMIGFFFAPK